MTTQPLRILQASANGQLATGKPVGKVALTGLVTIRRLLVGHLDA